MAESAKSVRRERKDVQRNLERVLSAAHELFAERGADVTMEEVARRAGVGIGTIYRRFPSKEHLFAAVSHAACDDIRQCLVEAAGSERDPRRQLRALVLVQYQHVADQSALVELRPGGDANCGGAAFEQQQFYDMLHSLFQHAIGEGQRQGALRHGDPSTLAALCLELLSPRAFQHLARVTGGPADQIAEQVVGFVLGGLGAHERLS